MARCPFTTRRATCTLFLGLAVIGCEAGSGNPLEPAESAVRASAERVAAGSNAPVLRFSDLSAVGESRINRTGRSVNYRLTTRELEPGHAYTLWIVIFNDPSQCTFGGPGVCGPDDVVNDLAHPDMMWAAGSVADAGGGATFVGRRRVGTEHGSVNRPVGLPAYGLEDPFGAEIQFVVHDHGPMIPQYMPDMITTLDGGCTDAGVPAQGVPSPWNDHEYGRRGPNTCQSVQFAVHAPQ